MADSHDGSYVRAPTLEDLNRICPSLNEAGARCVLIGGFAVIAHGGGRTPRDIGFLVDASGRNFARSDQVDCQCLEALLAEEMETRKPRDR